MKLKHNYLLTPFFALLSLLMLSACGSSGNSSDTQLVEGTVQGQAPYVVEAHQGSTAVVHASGDHSGTHSWTQVSGPTVVLSGTTTPTVTHTVPTTATTPIVLQHSTTNPQVGVITVTTHTVVPVPTPTATPPLPPLQVLVGKAKVVFSGDIASLHASATGGTPPYVYDWIPPTSITLDNTHANSPTFKAPNVSKSTDINVGLQVMDANGDTVTSNEVITIAPAPLSVTISGPRTVPPGTVYVYLTANAKGGQPSYSYEWSEVTPGASSSPIGRDKTLRVEASPPGGIPSGTILSYLVRVTTHNADLSVDETTTGVIDLFFQ